MSRRLTGIVCLVSGLILLFVALPITVSKTYPKIPVAVAVKDIPEDSRFTEDNIRLVWVGDLNMPKDILKPEEIIGKVAAVPVMSGDFITAKKVKPVTDEIAKELIPVGFTPEVVCLESGEEYLTGDIIRIADTNGEIPELSFVRVLSYIQTKDKGGTVVVALNQRQKEVTAENNNKLNASLVVRDNKELALKLLESQNDYFH